MAKVQKKGLVRIFNAYKYSMKGFKAGLENEAAIRQEMILSVILTIAAFFIADSSLKLVVLIAMPWLTVVVELLNSAVEAVVDRIGPEFHELSGRAKDLGSAAVFVMLILTLVTYVIFILEKFDVGLFN
ncbi:MAG: diacylglycerol kinase [Succinivibrio sp.]